MGKGTMKTSVKAKMSVLLLTGTLGLSACGATTSAEEPDGTDWATATSADEGGGMEALIAAAQEEGTLNVMGLYPDWANYGELTEAFTEEYGIEIDNDTSAGSSQDQINAIQNRVGQDRSLDYLDTGVSFANSAAEQGLLAEYRPQTAEDVADALKHPENMWMNQYGGFMTIGCDANAVEVCPTSFEELNDPVYEGQVALVGNPAQAEAGFNAVWAAALANGGSLDDIQPGIDYMAELSSQGILVPVEATTGTLETGETPIIINWDYLNLTAADETADAGVDFEVNIPTDGTMSSYYAASINEDAPNPAAARLWLEFIFSNEGQNIFLNGYTRPVRLDAMREAGTVDEEAAAQLPEAPEDFEYPTEEQRGAANEVLVENWDAAVAS